MASTTISNIVAKSAVAQWLVDQIETAGETVDHIEFNSDYYLALDGSESVYAWGYGVAANLYGCYSEERHEEFAGKILTADIGAQVIRNNGDILLHGVHDGVTWAIDVGKGVCERVQVGTRKVLKPAPDAPMIEVEEPIYETRCIDTLREAAHV